MAINTTPSEIIKPLAIKVAQVLRENAGVLSVVEKDMQNAPASLSETVTVGMSGPVAAGTVTPAAYISAFPTGITLKKAQVSLATWSKAEFAFDSRELALIEKDSYIPMQVQEAVMSVVAAMKSGVYTALRKTSGYVHSAQTTGFINGTDNLANITSARKELNQQFCPEGNRFLVIDSTEEAAALNNDQWLKSYAAGDANAFRNGQMGRVLGMGVYAENYSSLPIAVTAGTGTGYKLDGAHAKGAVSLKIDTGSGTILAGDSILIGSRSYTVKTELSAGYATIYEPGLLDAAENNADVTVGADRNISGFAFNPGAIMLVGRTPTAEGSLGTHQTITDPVTGLMLKLSVLPMDEAVMYRVSCLWGCDVVRPQLGCQISYS